MKQPKVKPCPACGDKHYTVYHSVSSRRRPWFLCCSYCKRCADRAWTKRGAIRKWNKSTAIVGLYNLHERR